jgi:phosphoserine phosphatase RsbU/P
MKFRGLALRYSLFFLAGILFVFTAAFLYLFTFSTRIFRDEGEKDAANFSALVIARVENALNRVESVPQTLRVAIQDDRANFREAERLLGLLVEENPYAFGSCIAFEPYSFYKDSLYYAPYLYESEGGLRHKFLGGPQYNYFERDWYRIPKETGKPQWSEPYYDEGGGDTLMCTYSVPFFTRDKYGKDVFHGVITVDISLTELAKIVTSVKLYKTGYGFLLSQKGKIIASPDSSVIFKDIRGTKRGKRGGEADSIIKMMLAGKTGFVKMGSFDSDEPSWLYFTPLSSTGWSFGLIFPREELFSAVYSLINGVMLVFVFSVLAMILVTILVTRKFIKPIRQLVKVTQRMGHGDFSVPIPVYRSNDEIAQLGNSFSLMKEELVDYIHNLKEATVAKEKIESELKVAHTIQMGLLPSRFPDRPDLDLYARLIPAKAVGGDLYDFFFLDDDHLFFAIGDVSGKGVPASLFMTLTRTLIRSYVSLEKPLSQSIDRVNDELCKENPNYIFVTFLTGILDLETGMAGFCNSGHNPPVLLKRDGTVEFVNLSVNIPLGIKENMVFNTDYVQIEAGDQLILYTDGITEATDASGSLYTEGRLIRLLNGKSGLDAPTLTQEIIIDIERFVADAEQADDITLLVFKYRPQTDTCTASGNCYSLKLKNRVEEVSRIESELRMLSERWELGEEMSGQLNLVMEEIFTNIVFYAYADSSEHDIWIYFERQGDVMKVLIKDDGRQFNIVSSVRADVTSEMEDRSIGGLGIHFVREFTDTLEYRRAGQFNEVIFTKQINHSR